MEDLNTNCRDTSPSTQAQHEMIQEFKSVKKKKKNQQSRSAANQNPGAWTSFWSFKGNKQNNFLMCFQGSQQTVIWQQDSVHLDVRVKQERQSCSLWTEALEKDASGSESPDWSPPHTRNSSVGEEKQEVRIF